LAYRLAGHTVLPLSADRTAVRFDTCFNGEYHEQYYVVLEFKAGTVSVRPPTPTLQPIYVHAYTLCADD